MTTIQKTIIAAVAAGAIVTGVYQARQVSNLREQVQTLEQQQEQQAALSNQVQELQRERDRATNALAALTAENAALKKSPNEVLKLRGEVGRLRQENAEHRLQQRAEQSHRQSRGEETAARPAETGDGA